MEARFLDKEQDFNQEKTTYWFSVDGAAFGVVHSSTDEPFVIDSDYEVIDGAQWIIDEVTDEMVAA